MRNETCRKLLHSAAMPGGGSILVLAVVVLAQAATPALARDGDHSGGGRDRGRPHAYQQVNLVSDLPNTAVLQDTSLVNAWGISHSSTSPFWVSANGTGLAVLYSVTNDPWGMTHVTRLSTEVQIPGEGNPTGQVFNDVGGFHSNLFLFVTEDGIISGWRPALGAKAEELASRSTAVYKGVTLATTKNGPRLLAANFGEATVDAYDTNSKLTDQFSDPRAPAGYAPFNVLDVHGLVFVTFAKQDAEKHDDAAGAGHGLIDVLNPNTGKFHRFATGSDAGGKLDVIDSPWGLALAPRHFGAHGDQLLVGNFGSGTIMTFDAEGRFRGFLEGMDQKPIVNEGLWGLTFGNGGRGGIPSTLYFSAGPGGEAHGLFGSLAPVARRDKDNDDDE